MSGFKPPFHETINKLLYAILQYFKGNQLEMKIPRPPYYNVTNDLLYEIFTSLNGVDGSITLAKRYKTTISGDGNTFSFTIMHNLNTEDIVISAREMSENLKEVFLDNYPDPTDPLNKLIISFDFAPTTMQSYRILIVG